MRNKTPQHGISIDPDNLDAAARIEHALLESLTPVMPDAGRGAAIRQRVLDRVRTSREQAARYTNVRVIDGEWLPFGEGARYKMIGEFGGVRSVLVEMDAGGRLPPHRHREHEECVVLRGEARHEDLVLAAGDYHLAPAGSRHTPIVSDTGALLYLRGVPLGDPAGMVRDRMTAWFPGKAAELTTVRSTEGDWQDLARGVSVKPLWDDGTERSLLVRLAPGARAPAHPHARDEECMVVEGEAEIGETLLRAGDFQLAPAGVDHGEVHSETGALLFVHGASARMATAYV